MSATEAFAMDPKANSNTLLSARSRRSSLSLSSSKANNIEKKTTARSQSTSPKRLSTSNLPPPRKSSPYSRQNVALPTATATVDKKNRKHALSSNSSSFHPPAPSSPMNPTVAFDIDEGVECQLVIDDTPSLVASDHLSDSSVSSILGGSPRQGQMKAVYPHGLVNLGNTCYFNSALQLLLATSKFTNDLCNHNFLQLIEEEDTFVKIPSYVVHVIMDGGEVVNTIGNGEYESAMEEEDSLLEESSEPEAQNESCVPCSCDNFVMVTEDRDEAENVASSLRNNSDEEIGESDSKQNEALSIAPLSHSLIDLARFLDVAPHGEREKSSNSTRATDEGRDTGQNRSLDRYATTYPNVANPKYLKDQLDAKSSLFYGYEQQDAHEFLVTMLDILHDELVAANKVAVDERKKKRKREAEKKAALEAEKAALEAHKASQRAKQAARAAKLKAEAEADAAAAAAGKEMFNQFKDCSKTRVLHTNETMSLRSQGEGSCEASNENKRWSGSIIDIETIACGVLESVTGALTERVGETSPTSFKSFRENSDALQQKEKEKKTVSNSRTTTTGAGPNGPHDDSSEADSFVHVANDDLTQCLEAEKEKSGNNEATKVEPSAPDITVNDTASPSDRGEMHARKDDGEKEEETDHEKAFLPTDNFHMEVDVQLECNGCNYKRSHKELYNHLSLDIGKNTSNAATLSEAVRTFFSPEEMELTCEQCGHRKATQRLRIVNAPHALLLHVKRFNVEYDAQWRPKVRKNHSRIEFRETLRLETPTSSNMESASLGKSTKPPLPRTAHSIGGDSVYLQDGAIYGLKAVVHHLGHSVNSGHYVADALHPTGPSLFVESSLSGQKPKWHRFNDSQVTEISRKEVFGASAQSTAYLLMYELQADPLDFSTMPTSKKKGWKTIPAWKPLKLSKTKSSATSRSGRRLIVS